MIAPMSVTAWPINASSFASSMPVSAMFSPFEMDRSARSDELDRPYLAPSDKSRPSPCAGHDRVLRFPHRANVRRCRVEVRVGAARELLEVLPELVRRGAAPEPVADVHLVNHQAGPE